MYDEDEYLVVYVTNGQCNVLNDLDVALEIRHWQRE